jgi:hypothetical protein
VLAYDEGVVRIERAFLLRKVSGGDEKSEESSRADTMHEGHGQKITAMKLPDGIDVERKKGGE